MKLSETPWSALRFMVGRRLRLSGEILCEVDTTASDRVRGCLAHARMYVAGFSYSSDKNGRKRKSFSELGRSASAVVADGAFTACAMAPNGHG